MQLFDLLQQSQGFRRKTIESSTVIHGEVPLLCRKGLWKDKVTPDGADWHQTLVNV